MIYKQGFMLAFQTRQNQIELLHHANMKELWFDMDDGVSRMAFAVDLELQVILLFSGNK